MVELVEFQVFPKDMGTRCFHALQPHESHPKSHRLLQHSHLLHSGGIFSKVNDYTATQETSKTQLALSSLATYTFALLWQEALAVTTTQAWKLIKLIFLKRKTREKRNTHKSKGWWRGPTREWKLMCFFFWWPKKTLRWKFFIPKIYGNLKHGTVGTMICTERFWASTFF